MEVAIQVIVNGLFAGTVLALPAIGFNLMAGVLNYPNFAIGAFITAGAYIGWLANVYFDLPLVACCVVGFMVSGALGVLTESLVSQNFSKAGPIMLAVALLAAGMVVESTLRLCFGNGMLGFQIDIVPDTRIAGIRFGHQQVENLAFSTGIMMMLWALLRYSRAGQAMRALADNPELARLRGVNINSTTALVVFVGAGVAGVGGILLGADASLDPLLGSRLLVSIFAAAVLGGFGSVPGALVGALAIGVAEEMAAWGLTPTYRSVASFLIILVILSVKPSGLFGKRIRQW